MDRPAHCSNLGPYRIFTQTVRVAIILLTPEELKKFINQRFIWIDCLPYVSIVWPRRGITQNVSVG